MGYAKEERETVIQLDDMSQEWRIYSRQRKIITKLLKMDTFVELRREVEDDRIIEIEGYFVEKALTFRLKTDGGARGSNLAR